MNLEKQISAIEHAIQFLKNTLHFSSKGAENEAQEIANKLTRLLKETSK